MADKCYAPVFKGTRNFFGCIILLIVYISAIIVLVFFIWIPTVRCLIKQYVYRIRHCTEGNTNPEIEL